MKIISGEEARNKITDYIMESGCMAGIEDCEDYLAASILEELMLKHVSDVQIPIRNITHTSLSPAIRKISDLPSEYTLHGL